ncbi:MAG: FmdE family protein [Christensenellales bacterium]|jgi:formylmethanofuran dehydrogenase subunit E
MRTFEEDVALAVQYHGHLCSGQCIGVKMARLAMRKLEIDIEKDPKSIMVFVECDRCPADAIGIVCGCKVGKRTYKFYDFGKVAASFVNLNTGKAVRIWRKNRRHPKEGEDMVAFYKNLPDEEMFQVQEVEIDLKPWDMPGPPLEVAICSRCGEDVTDCRHLMIDDKPVCKACNGQSYYKAVTDGKA